MRCCSSASLFDDEDVPGHRVRAVYPELARDGQGPASLLSTVELSEPKPMAARAKKEARRARGGRRRGGLAAIVLAAGKGTRMRSSRAKVLHEILGRPLVAYPVELARALGAEPVVAVLGHQREAVEAALRGALRGRRGDRRRADRAARDRPRGHAWRCRR